MDLHCFASTSLQLLSRLSPFGACPLDSFDEGAPRSKKNDCKHVVNPFYHMHMRGGCMPYTARFHRAREPWRRHAAPSLRPEASHSRRSERPGWSERLFLRRFGRWNIEGTEDMTDGYNIQNIKTAPPGVPSSAGTEGTHGLTPMHLFPPRLPASSDLSP